MSAHREAAELFPLVGALAERGGGAPPSRPAATILVSAALSCFNAAVNQWGASDGRQQLVGLVDEAFLVVTAA
ncbi:hypothetical protein [Streptomyces sp. S.PB5]|uniref:hypothetical protein n=1 Tax=Streptomyces sp. S.PB5 TaxID=3020844 RepID=UPI0025AF8FD4|nr:hypothetical protein [Streptomyces sp. S.PB5]MDN3028531.1 hypothetical protein [Streptomyces sp. S.PB5]